MSWLRSVARMLRLGVVLLRGSAELLLRRPKTRAARAMWLHQLCSRAIRVFGIAVEVTGRFPERGVLISNHLSYLDIVVFASIAPCAFVAKAEIGSWPLLGWMTTMAGTVYVQRGRGGSAREAGSEMRVAAADGLPVVLFPEGTTSNGEGVLKFHSGLLSEALAAGQPVTASALRYSLGEENGGATASEAVAWWGDGPMWPHVFRLLSLRGIRAEVRFAGEPMRFGSGAKRKEVAVEARDAVCRLRDEGCVRVEEMDGVTQVS